MFCYVLSILGNSNHWARENPSKRVQVTLERGSDCQRLMAQELRISGRKDLGHRPLPQTWGAPIYLSLIGSLLKRFKRQNRPRSGVSNLQPLNQIPHKACFCAELRMVFPFLNVGKNQKNTLLWHMKIIWDSNFSINEVLLEHSFSHSFAYYARLLWGSYCSAE